VTNTQEYKSQDTQDNIRVQVEFAGISFKKITIIHPFKYYAAMSHTCQFYDMEVPLQNCLSKTSDFSY
jgi:hypothetical protein